MTAYLLTVSSVCFEINDHETVKVVSGPLFTVVGDFLPANCHLCSFVTDSQVTFSVILRLLSTIPGDCLPVYCQLCLFQWSRHCQSGSWTSVDRLR